MLTKQKQIDFYRDPANLLHDYDETAENIYDKLFLRPNFKEQVLNAKRNIKERITIWRKCWELASEENHNKVFHVRKDMGSEEYDVNELSRDWMEGLNKFYEKKRVNEIETKKQVEIIEKDARLKERFSLKDEFLRVFQKKSYNNTIIGESLYYSLITVLLRKQRVKIENKTGIRDKIIMPIPSFFVQKSGTGKDESLDFLQDQIDLINKKVVARRKPLLLIHYNNLSGGETPEVYFNHPEMTAQGQVKRKGLDNKDGIIKGKLEKFDMLFVRECSFLFRLRGKDKQSILEILLQALEGREISKELISWGGKLMPTNANCAFIGLSRPVTDVQDVITGSGLLQRSLFYGRKITKDEQKGMYQAIAENEVTAEEFRRDMDALADKIVDFYINIDSDRFKLSETKMGRQLVREYKEQKLDMIYGEVRSEMLQEALTTFINRTDSIATRLAFVNCWSSGGKAPDDADIKNALNFLERIFNCLVIWLDVNLVDNMIKFDMNLEYRLKSHFKDSVEPIKQAVVVKKIIDFSGKTHPTALAWLRDKFVGRNKVFRAVGEKEYELN